jgi:hypothetical protein
LAPFRASGSNLLQLVAERNRCARRAALRIAARSKPLALRGDARDIGKIAVFALAILLLWQFCTLHRHRRGAPAKPTWDA